MRFSDTGAYQWWSTHGFVGCPDLPGPRPVTNSELYEIPCHGAALAQKSKDSRHDNSAFGRAIPGNLQECRLKLEDPRSKSSQHRHIHKRKPSRFWGRNARRRREKVGSGTGI